jgi:hypothetical protein
MLTGKDVIKSALGNRPLKYQFLSISFPIACGICEGLKWQSFLKLQTENYCFVG